VKRHIEDIELFVTGCTGTEDGAVRVFNGDRVAAFLDAEAEGRTAQGTPLQNSPCTPYASDMGFSMQHGRLVSSRLLGVLIPLPLPCMQAPQLQHSLRRLWQ
jgi:hypothetical protein